MTRTRHDVLLAVTVGAAAAHAPYPVLRDRGAPAPARAPAPPSATATFFAAPPPEGPRGYGGESEADAHHSIRALATPPERVPVSSARAPSPAGHSPGF